MTKAKMVDMVLDAVGVKDRMMDGLRNLEERLQGSNVNFDVNDFEKTAADYVDKTMLMYAAEYDKRFSEAELAEVIAFCGTPSGGKFLSEIFKVNRHLSNNLFFGGAAP